MKKKMTKCISTLNNILTGSGGLSRLPHIKNHAPSDVGWTLWGEITVKLNVEQERTERTEAKAHMQANNAKTP